MNPVSTAPHNEMVVIPDSFTDLADLIDAAVAKVATLPLGLESDDDLLAGMETLERAWRRADGANTAVLMEVSDRSAYTKASGRIQKARAMAHEAAIQAGYNGIGDLLETCWNAATVTEAAGRGGSARSGTPCHRGCGSARSAHRGGRRGTHRRRGKADGG